MPELHFALYTSKSQTMPSPDFHNEILRVSQRNNTRDSLSGFLHREGDFFIQFLEGPKTKLHNRLAKIGRDPRHSEFTILQSAPLEARLFPDWQMGFVTGEHPTLSGLLECAIGTIELKSAEPIDLIVFLADSASFMRNMDVVQNAS